MTLAARGLFPAVLVATHLLEHAAQLLQLLAQLPEFLFEVVFRWLASGRWRWRRLRSPRWTCRSRRAVGTGRARRAS